jgi:putative transposase
MQSFSHSYGDSTYHIWWITKCRYKTLRNRGHKYVCKDALYQVAKRHRITIRSLAIEEDHIHAVISIPPSMSVSKAFQLLKGASSFVMFRAFPDFRKRYPRGSFWGAGGKFRSVGDVEINEVMNYVNSKSQTTLSCYVPEFPGLQSGVA